MVALLIVLGILAVITISGTVAPIWGISVASFFLVMIVLLSTTNSRNFFSKIEISQEGIIWKYKKKVVISIRWNEITAVKEEPHLRNLFLVIYSGQDKIQLDLTKNMFKAIISICPNDRVKDDILKLDFIKLRSYR